ncbi:1795_t:CDS:1 [Funneliformis geosporum]|uniref:6623_t:CDS:1 n=1 Tax=Funneliformis geosporum TaxID=1117311 RepID=A0A9W4SL94_9GLOM|nr:1795_t:CDS:1 [Funneliformis geosporum]CAI2173226.1 6623_t:CDS:1 [Funneliformis geosporum]
MNSQTRLNSDCLKRIFEHISYSSEYLHITHKTLHSCILVSKHFCENAMPILWRNPWNPSTNKFKNNYNKKFSISKTILSCLLYHHQQENDLMEINESTNSTDGTTFKPPLFDYISYCKYVDYQDIEKIAQTLLDRKHELNIFIKIKYKKNTLLEYIWKLFMVKCNNLEYLRYPNNVNISTLPGSQNSLESLNELECEVKKDSSHLKLTINYTGLAKICFNLKRIIVKPLDKDNRGLATLIRAQNGLKELNLFTNQNAVKDLRFIDQALLIQSHSLETLTIKGNFYFQNSFLSSLHNLKRLQIKLAINSNINYLLDSAILPNLEFLSIQLNYYAFDLSLDHYSRLISRTKGHLRKFEIINATRPPTRVLGLQPYLQSIITHCPQINSVRIWYINDFLNDFKHLLINAEHLNSIELDFLEMHLNDYYTIFDDDESEREREHHAKLLLDALACLSSHNLNHLYLHNLWWLLPRELNHFLESWKKKLVRLTLKLKANRKVDLNSYLDVIEKHVKAGTLTDDSGLWVKEFPY